MKNITYWVVVASLMLSTSMVMNAYAKPGEKRFSREDVRAARGKLPAQNRTNDKRSSEAGQDQAKKPGGKMSPDERRALRRQINDAGRDIYKP